MTPAAERTVFVVDDDAAALDSLVMLLRSDGLNPRGFSSAAGFLDTLTSDARGCIISDVRMPGMDGVQLLRTLKSMQCLLPVIVRIVQEQDVDLVDAQATFDQQTREPVVSFRFNTNGALDTNSMLKVNGSVWAEATGETVALHTMQASTIFGDVHAGVFARGEYRRDQKER